MKRLSPAEGRERRERYCELRRQGMGKTAAALEIGLTAPSNQANQYEHWFQALERGEEVVVRRPGGAPGRPRGGAH